MSGSLSTQKINVGDNERTVSTAIGALLLLLLIRRSLGNLLLIAAGGWLLYRGLTGNCKIYEALDIDTSGRARSDELGGDPMEHWSRFDRLVEEASEESFPASDPPAYSQGID